MVRKSDSKFDAALRMEIKAKGVEDVIPCFIQLKNTPTIAQRTQLEKIGIKIISSVEAIIVAEGKSKALYKAAELDFVKHIALSQKKKLY